MRPGYFSATVLVAEPPELLRTVMLPGFDATPVNAALYLPPLGVRVPISAFVDAT